MQLCTCRIFSKGYHIMDILLSSIECKCKKSMIHCTLPDQHQTACCNSLQIASEKAVKLCCSGVGRDRNRVKRTVNMVHSYGGSKHAQCDDNVALCPLDV